MKNWLLVLPLVLLGVATAQAAIKTEQVEYKAGDTKLKGYLAYDDAVRGKRPGVLVVHEWWGLNDYVKKRARMLAEQGYTAFALDMYGDGKQATHPKDAGKFAAAVRSNMPVAKARFEAARTLLAGQPTVDPEHIAALGYCFGGGIVLEMARRGAPLDGVVSFHGSLSAARPAKADDIRARVLVFTGAADPMAPPEVVQAFRKEMDAAQADYRVVVYPGAKHSFTNPEADAFGKKFDMPLAYDPEADRDSWAQTLQFLQQIFQED